MKLEEFLKKHNACPEGKEWALNTGCATIEEIWLRDDLKTAWRIWIAQRVLSENQLRKFACLCVRQVWDLLKDERSKNAVEVAERFYEGMATIEELAAASAAARDAARDAAWAAAWAAASDVARDAAWDAARAAASAAAWAAARDVAWDAAWAAAWEKQNTILLQIAPTITV